MTVADRSAHLDNAKALLIALVVFGHTVSPLAARSDLGHAVLQLVLVFHMPAFAFVSGYLSKRDAFTKKGAFTLLTLAWAYLLFNLVNYIWAWTLDGRAVDLWRVVYAPDYTAWFLLALFWWRLSLIVLGAGTKPVHAAVSVAVAVAIAVGSGYMITRGGYLAVSRTTAFLPFFIAGYRIRQLGWALPGRSERSRVVAVAAFVAVFAALFVGGAVRDDDLLFLGRSFLQKGNMTVWAGAARLAVMCTSAALTAAFLALVPRRRHFFTVVGATTMSVYVWHALTLRVLRQVGLDDVLIGTWPAAVASVLLMVAVFGFGPIPRVTQYVLSLGRRTAPRASR